MSGAVLAVDASPAGRGGLADPVPERDEPLGTVLLQEVVPTTQLTATAARLIHTYAPTVIMGNGTTSAAARARIEELGTEVTLVDEYRTTDAAKAAYWTAPSAMVSMLKSASAHAARDACAARAGGRFRRRDTCTAIFDRSVTIK